MTDTGEIWRCDALIADTGNPCIYVAGHGGNHRWPDDRQDHWDEIRYQHLVDRYAALAAENAALRAKRDRLLAVLNDIYPALASRVLALKVARETVALHEWEGIARLVYDVLCEAAMTKGRSAPQDEHTSGNI
jgi:hypothetical protein